MPTLPPYVQQRRQGLYAVLEIPKPLRDHFGRPRFIESLKTRDVQTAGRRVVLLVTKWKAAIEKARGTTSSPAALLAWEAQKWREIIQEEKDPKAREVLEVALDDQLERIEQERGIEAALEASAIAQGRSIPLHVHQEPWLASIGHLSEKTKDAHERAVGEFCDHFRTAQKISRQSLKEYLGKLRTEKGWSDQTVTKNISFFRSFVGYVDETHQTTLLPLFSLKGQGKTAAAKTSKQRSWLAFSPDDVSKLYGVAKASPKQQDQTLADLIALGAYTGCRIEEIGQLRVEHVTGESLRIEDAKTAAGIREVPIHKTITPLVERLVRDSEDGFLIPATAATYSKRTNALGTRFGRLKTAHGFSERHVFHSIRKTVVSQLEQAGVSENVTADLVGHEKPRITYGLYSSGTSLAQKAEALGKVGYPGLLGRPA